MTKTKLSDSSLISLYKKGNEEAFSFLVKKYSSKVYSAVYFIVKDKYIIFIAIYPVLVIPFLLTHSYGLDQYAYI